MHVPTLFAVLVLITVVMAGSIALVAHKEHPDLQAWAWALGLQVVAYTLLIFRSAMPEGVSVVLGNAAFSACITLYCFGLYRFANRPANWLALGLPMVLMLATNLVWLADFHTRFLIHSLLYAGQAMFLLTLLRHCYSPATRRGVWLLGLGEVLFILVMLGRFVVVATGWTSTTAYNESNAVQGAVFLASLTSTMTLALGILMMTQQRTEHQLGVSERHYRQLTEAASEGICILQNGMIAYANPCMHQLFGYAPERMLGSSIQSLVSTDDWPLVQRNHQQRLAGLGDDLKYPVRMNTLHAGERWFEISGVRIEWHGQVATLNFLNDITQRRDQEEHIKNLAYHDTLTQLPNRRLLLDRIGQAQASTSRNQHWAALVFLDLDRFKLLNDTHGHRAGDHLLVEVGHRLGACVRGTDTVARLGGDEFVVLLFDVGNTSDQSVQAAQHVTTKMLHALAQPYQLPLDDDPASQVVVHQCSASAGLALFSGSAPAAETLLEQADAAMYAAKNAGRNQLRMHAPDAPATTPSAR